MKGIRPVLGVLLVSVLADCCLAQEKYESVYGQGAHKLVVATGSPGELGLLKVLAERFARAEDATVYWRKAGSGRSLQLLREKKVDAVMVHAPAAEAKAVKEGWAARRTLIGSNEFFIVGPAEDPAGIRAANSAAGAFRKIAAGRAEFLSRGDSSGTHKKEILIWKKAGITPRGDWYVTTGDFMRATLRRANAEKAYFMTDSSTWFAERSRLPHLKLLFRGDSVLVNVYHALCQPAGATPAAPLAARFVAFLASKEAQKVFGEYGVEEYGRALYHDTAYTAQHLKQH